MNVFYLNFLVFLVLFNFCEFKNTNDIKHSSIALRNITNVLFETSGEVTVVRFYDDSEILKIMSMSLNIAGNEQVPFSVRNIKYERVKKYEQWTFENITFQKNPLGNYQLKNSILFLSTFQKLKLYFKARKQDEILKFGIFSDELSRILTTPRQQTFKTYLTYVHAFDSDLDFLREFEREIHLTEKLYFLVEDENFISLKTIVWLQKGQCENANMIEINSFSKKDNVWRNTHFTIKKFRNLHGCGISVETGLAIEYGRSPLTSVSIKNSHNNFQLYSDDNHEKKLVQTLMACLNFSKLTRAQVSKYVLYV